MTSNVIKKIFILSGWIVFLSFAAPALSPAADITASVDSRSTMLGESFKLTLRTDSTVTNQPDFSPIKRNFNIIESRKEGETTWHLTLQGKRIGIFTVPAIHFGKDRSPSIRVAVKPVSEKSTLHFNNRPIALEVETDVEETWVQSQIIYTVRLLQSIKLTNVALSPVKTNDPDAIIEKLGATRKYEKKIDGTPYLVSEIRYAIFPQHSGELVFEPMLLQARISAAASRILMEQFMEQGRTKVVRSSGLRIKIKPKPTHIETHTWIPANNLRLTEEWNADRQKIKVGEPLTRMITVQVDGMTGAQLPDIKLAQVEGIKQYSESSTVNDAYSSQGIVGAKKIRSTVFAMKEGRFILPAITLSWWNTVAGKLETARLDEVVLETSGTVSGKAPDKSVITPATDKEQPRATIAHVSNNWIWASLTLAIAWLITLLLLIRKTCIDKSKTDKTQMPPATDLRPLEKAVLAEAKAKHAVQCKNALLHWARNRWPNSSYNNLTDIARLCPDSLGQEILALNALLYTNSSGEWNGLRLADTFQNFRPQKTRRHNHNPAEFELLFKNQDFRQTSE